MAEFIVEIQGRGPYQVEAPSLEVLTQATERWSEWLRAGGDGPPRPTQAPITTPSGAPLPEGYWTGLGSPRPQVPNEGVNPEEGRTQRELEVFGGFLTEAIRGARPLTEQVGDWTRNVGNALTFDNFNEIVAGADNLLGNRDGMTFEQRLDYEDQMDAQHRLANPVASTAIDVAGGLATPYAAFRAGLSPLSGARASAASIVPRTAAEGAIYGGAAGFGTGDGFNLGERMRNAGAGAASGAAIGAAAGTVGGALANRSIVARSPTREDLTTGINANYQGARNLGVQLETVSFDSAIRGIQQNMGSQYINATRHPQAASALEDLLNNTPPAPTLEEFDIIRQNLQEAARTALAQGNRADARLANSMVNQLDNYYLSLTPNDVLSGDPQAALSLVSRGRELWLNRAKSDIIAEAIEGAEVSSGVRTGTPASRQSALANEFRQIANDPVRMRMFSPEERSLINEVAGGSWTENTLRRIGALAPTNMLSMAGLVPAASGIAAGAALGGPRAAAAVAATGETAGRLSGAMTSQNAALLGALTRSGGAAMPNAAVIPFTQGVTATGASQLVQSPPAQAFLGNLMPPPPRR